MAIDERWRELSRLFAAALERPPQGRPAFLERACSTDPELRSEVESLLAAHARSGPLDGPGALAGALAGPEEISSAAPPALAPGARLGPYEIVSLLAEGGMGEVYRARDPRLGREVAIKRIRGAADPSALRRFAQEARAAGALSHPNLLAVFDVGEERGIPYVVTELLEGETLRERLSAGPLPLADCLGLARQILAGLAAAHDKGIVHRDLKPGNLLVTADGRAKILDFGLAKPVGGALATREPTLTGTGFLVGTPGYTSPEQLRGRLADPRSDLFAFGAVLYEMLTGEPAFAGDTAAERLGATLWQEPRDLAARRPEAPPELVRLVARCLAREPRERFASASEALLALAAVGEKPAPGLAIAAPRERVVRRSVAVLPFRPLDADAESLRLGLGLADAAITELAGLRSLTVRPTSAILRYQDGEVDPQQAGRELGVEAVVEGSLQHGGAGLRVTVRLVATTDGHCLWAAKLDTAMEDLFQVQDEVARNLARALEVELTAGEEERHAHWQRLEPKDGRAYEHYLRGRAHFLRATLDDYIAAADWFEKSRDTDPGFALAWAGLADAYARIAFDFQPGGNWYERAEAACRRALELEPGLPEGLYARARLRWSPRGGWDHAGALRDLLAAVAARPSLDEAHLRTGAILNHVGLLQEAIAQLEIGLALNPQHLNGRYLLAFCRYHQGRYEEALSVSRDTARRAPAPWIFYQTALCELRLGRQADAEATAGHLGSRASPIRALLAALRGQRQEAHQEIFRTGEEGQAIGQYHHAQYECACALSLLGELEPALDWLEGAARNGYPCTYLFERDPFLDPLRSEERFARLLAELRESTAGYRRLLEELATE